MIIPKSLPKIKQFFSGVCHRPFVVAYATRLIAGFLDHHGRMSAGQAAGSVASLSRHPAAIGRFLDRYGGWLWSMRKRLSDRLLEAAGNAAGVFVFILDATDVTQQGIKTDNTFSTGNRKPAHGPIAPLQQTPRRPPLLPPPCDGVAAHAFGRADSLLSPLLHARLLPSQRSPVPHSGRLGRGAHRFVERPRRRGWWSWETRPTRPSRCAGPVNREALPGSRPPIPNAS